MSLLPVATGAARMAGAVILEAGDGPLAEEKGAGDYVTAIDREAEATIVRELSRRSPGVPVVAEEGGGEPADRYWLVDPLDGTTNFLHGFPAVGVSVALIEDGRPVVGVVHAPFLAETYWAVEGEGAFAERAGTTDPLAVSRRVVAEAIVATGFPFRRKELIPRHLEMVRRGLGRFEDLRRPGAASLDLAWVAAGVFEGFFELNLSSWDVAAGALLVREAGGAVTDWSGGPDFLSGDILAGSPSVHTALVDIAGAAPER